MQIDECKETGAAGPPSFRRRSFLGFFCLLFLAALMTGAAVIPFLFETGSILYKLGTDKVLLRTGKIAGLAAAALFLLQPVISGRFKSLDSIFGLNMLYVFHRIIAGAIAVLALLHPLLVFAPEDISSIPLKTEYWSEGLGVVMLFLIWLIFATGTWRRFLDFRFDRWWIFHRASVFSVFLMLVLHVLYVSETFESGTPRLIVIIAAGLYMLVMAWIKTRHFFPGTGPFTVSGIRRAAHDAYALKIKPVKGDVFQYYPGQFAFFSFKSNGISSEEHPFTISSSPSRPGELGVTIRCSGDWTGMVGRISPGDKVFIDGPYGRFGHLFIESSDEYIMVAGGIGITPMLSMLRYMADNDCQAKTTLIWSNRTEADIIFPDEFAELENRLNGLRINYIFTRQNGGARLNSKSLGETLSGCSRRAPVFLCGPPIMMKEVRAALVKNGFSPGRIYSEEFSL